MQLFLVSLILLALAFIGIAIKMFVRKDGQFEKQCLTIEFETGEKLGCVCTAEKHEDCIYYKVHHGEEVNSEKVNSE
jgi:hypothetical protein